VSRLRYDPAIDAFLGSRLLVAGSVFAATLEACVRAGASAEAAYDALLDEAVWLDGRPAAEPPLNVEAVLHEASLLLGFGPAGPSEFTEPPA